MESYTLFQLNEYVRRVIALNFREPLWIEAEIAQIKDSRGNQYLELIEKEEDGDQVIAQISAAIWYRNYQFIKKKLGDLIYDLLTEGTQVRLKCTVDFHERYGMKLVVQDIDPNYTFGKLEIKRQEIINRLETEGLMELNKSLILPNVIQKIAVISSEGAAGYQDFLKQLTENTYGYTFKIDLYNCAVQGVKVQTDTLAAIKEIISKKIPYDVVAIIRGGGSKLDLSGYDNYDIAKDIALSEVPFIIGIGHDIDSTVTDLVACLTLKTPTAVADYIIDRNMTFEARLEQSLSQVYRLSNGLLREHEIRLNSVLDRLSAEANKVLTDQEHIIGYAEDQLNNVLQNNLEKTRNLHERISLILDAHDPSRILNQGYSYVRKEGKIIKSVMQLTRDEEIEIHLSDGSVHSKIL